METGQQNEHSCLPICMHVLLYFRFPALPLPQIPAGDRQMMLQIQNSKAKKSIHVFIAAGHP